MFSKNDGFSDVPETFWRLSQFSNLPDLLKHYTSIRRRRCTKILALNRIQENLRDNFVFERTVYM